jgi:hypothetical protein
MARFLDDLRDATDQFGDERVRRDGFGAGLTAVVRLLEALAESVAPETAQEIRATGTMFVLVAEVLDAMPAREADRIFAGRVLRRFRRAYAAAGMEALVRKGWRRCDAAEYVGRQIGVSWKLVAGWRDTLRREQPVTFAELQAHSEKLEKRRATDIAIRQAKDVAVYTEALRIAADDSEDELVARIDGWLAGVVLEKNAAEVRNRLRQHSPRRPNLSGDQ